jgi:hypothetical protein
MVHLLHCTQLTQQDGLNRKSLSNTAYLFFLYVFAPLRGVLAYGEEAIDIVYQK